MAKQKQYIDVVLVRDKLRNINEYVRDDAQYFQDFGNFLIKYLPKKRISPRGFLFAWNRAYDHLRKGRVDRKKLRRSLANIDGLGFFKILAACPMALKAIFPPDLAKIGQEIIKNGEWP